MNEQEANKKANNMIEARKSTFCPLTKEPCNTLCECYKMPEVIGDSISGRDGSIVFRIRHGFCTCYALKGASD